MQNTKNRNLNRHTVCVYLTCMMFVLYGGGGGGVKLMTKKHYELLIS